MNRHAYASLSELNIKVYADIRFYFQTLSSVVQCYRSVESSPERVCWRLKWLKFGKLSLEAGIRVKST